MKGIDAVIHHLMDIRLRQFKQSPTNDTDGYYVTAYAIAHCLIEGIEGPNGARHCISKKAVVLEAIGKLFDIIEGTLKDYDESHNVVEEMDKLLGLDNIEG